MQTVQQFGQTIKSKYPQYNDMSDEELGRKMLVKFPQYSDMVSSQPTDQGSIESGIAKTGLFDTPVVGGLIQSLTHPLIKGAETAAEGVKAAGDLYNNWGAISKDKSLLDVLSGNGNKVLSPEAAKPAFISQDENKHMQGSFADAMGEGARTGAGAASYFLPGLNVAKGGGVVNALVNKAVTGGVRGAMYGSDQGANFDPTTTAGMAGAGAILEPLIGGLSSGMLSKGGVYNKMEQAAAKGADINWDSVVQTAKNAAKNKAPSVQRALDNLIAEETPASAAQVQGGVEGLPQTVDQINPGTSNNGGTLLKRMGGVKPGVEGPPGYLKDIAGQAVDESGYGGPLRAPTPYSGGGDVIGDISSPSLPSKQALELRKALGDRLPQGFFDKLNTKISPAEQDAINILRRTVSSHLKQAAPDIKTPDQLYTLYKTMKGDIPTWARRVIIGQVANQFLPKEFRGLPTDIAEVLLQMGVGL